MEAALLLFHAVLSPSQHSWGLFDCTEQDSGMMFALRAPYQKCEQHPRGNGGFSLRDFSKHATSPAQVGASMEREMCCAVLPPSSTTSSGTVVSLSWMGQVSWACPWAVGSP